MSVDFLGGSLSAAVLPVTAAFVADLTSASQRDKGMAWMGSAAGLGMMVGPALGGWLAEVDFSREYQLWVFVFDAFLMPFFTAGGLALLALAATIIWVREPPDLQADRTGVSLMGMLSGLMARKSFRTLLYFPFLVQFAMALFEGTFAFLRTWAWY